MYVLLRLKLRSTRRRESQLARQIATKAAEIAVLQERLSDFADLEAGAEELKAEVRRTVAIRGRTEDRLVEQNAELESLRNQLAEQAAVLLRLRKLVEHVDDF
jgi:septal ring factor EnvC (AmiA/AmiB activator)